MRPPCTPRGRRRASPPQVDRVLVLNTAHIAFATCERATKGSVSHQLLGDLPFPFLTWKFGVMIWVDEQSDPKGTPDDLKPVLAYARHLRCRWIRFDCDGDIRGDLPTYEWP